MKVLVTGAAGQLGSETVASLVRAGHSVVATDQKFRADLGVRFETAETAPGPVRSYRADDADLKPWRPEPEEGTTVPDMHQRHR